MGPTEFARLRPLASVASLIASLMLPPPGRLAPARGPALIADPKLDGKRAQLHVREHRTVHD